MVDGWLATFLGDRMALLEITALKKYFPVQKGFLDRLLAKKLEYVRAVDGVDFSIQNGEVFGLVGESGCGKSTLARLILRLIEPTGGKVMFDGADVTSLDPHGVQKMRRRMQMIFQDPYAALSPRMRIGDAISHPLRIHGIGDKDERARRLDEVLNKVGLSPPEYFYSRFPHELSGGQRQRVVIARSLVLDPDIIVADEPVSMLDVSVRSEILRLMMRLKKDLGLTYLYITHDLSTAEYVCDRIAIMYLGKIVEHGAVSEIYDHPLHPYTKALLSAIPVPNPRLRHARELPKGEIPSPIKPPSGCRFHPRCKYATDRCGEIEPTLETMNGHGVACHRAGEIE